LDLHEQRKWTRVGAHRLAQRHHDELLRLVERQGPKDQCVGDAEGGGVGADGNREAKNARERPAGSRRQQAAGESNVAREISRSRCHRSDTTTAARIKERKIAKNAQIN
jgi:hypothetical protein